MKKRSILLALVLGMGLFATSCSDDNGGETLAPLAGKWDISQVGTTVGTTEMLIDAPQNQSGCEKDYMDLNGDNTVTIGNYDSAVSACVLTTDEGIYSRSHNNLTRVVNGVTIVQDIVNLSLTELKLKNSSGIIEVYVKH
ncbi:lipocalin family protein [Flavobacterium sp. RSB2_4_14]|uniref:lipocalin family protein n=1 Tax=Flavobacterium sp. RSB2_4_14 TaxID=3447665 RepID=UPI003F41AF63